MYVCTCTADQPSTVPGSLSACAGELPERLASYQQAAQQGKNLPYFVLSLPHFLALGALYKGHLYIWCLI